MTENVFALPATGPYTYFPIDVGQTDDNIVQTGIMTTHSQVELLSVCNK